MGHVEHKFARLRRKPLFRFKQRQSVLRLCRSTSGWTPTRCSTRNCCRCKGPMIDSWRPTTQTWKGSWTLLVIDGTYLSIYGKPWVTYLSVWSCVCWLWDLFWDLICSDIMRVLEANTTNQYCFCLHIILQDKRFQCRYHLLQRHLFDSGLINAW